uniref:Immunoglobulin V-set domain-containing protein n=1 Tax=Sander lucioperca TaxID=283035 RepID=A0A8C9YR05_SANLU
MAAVRHHFIKLRTEQLTPPSHVTKETLKSCFSAKRMGSICEDILSTKSSPKSNGSFTLTETSSSFNMSISNVSSEHAGVYWCGVKGEKQTFNTFSNVGKFSMMDDKVKRNITITVRNVTTEDTGTYWCGAERNDPKQSNPFFHRLMMTVGESSYFILWMLSDPGSDCEEIITVTVCVSVVVLLLLFVLILILIYKRKSYYWFAEHQTHAHMVHTKPHGRYLHPEYIYEEIQEQPHNPDSGNAMNTMYATANFPTSPSASLHYSTVNFKNRSDKAGAEILLTKPSSSACEYSTVKNSQSQTSSTVNQPSSEDPLYSTVNKSRQQ